MVPEERQAIARNWRRGTRSDAHQEDIGQVGSHNLDEENLILHAFLKIISKVSPSLWEGIAKPLRLGHKIQSSFANDPSPDTTMIDPFILY